MGKVYWCLSTEGEAGLMGPHIGMSTVFYPIPSLRGLLGLQQSFQIDWSSSYCLQNCLSKAQIWSRHFAAQEVPRRLQNNTWPWHNWCTFLASLHTTLCHIPKLHPQQTPSPLCALFCGWKALSLSSPSGKFQLILQGSSQIFLRISPSSVLPAYLNYLNE